MFEAACQINGGSNEKNARVPGEVGVCSTTVKKCSGKILVEVFSKSDKVTHGVIPKIYKESLNVYDSSDENMLRSIAVYYSGGVMGNESIGPQTGIVVIHL